MYYFDYQFAAKMEKHSKPPLPTLHPGFWERFIYYMFELCCWSIWYRHSRSVHGNLPDAPLVLVANHGSYLDWLLLHVVLRRKFRRKVQFMAKEKVVENPLFRVLVRATESVVVSEGKKLRAIALVAKVFSSSSAEAKPIFCIFPEGTRTRDGEPLPNMNGGVWLARKTNTILIPVALCGFWEAWPPSSPLPKLRRRHLAIHFLEPVHLADFPDDQQATDFAMKKVYEAVRRERAIREQKVK